MPCLLFFSVSVILSPVPEIHWKKLEGPLPPNHEVRMAGAHLHLYNVQFEDGGTYQCEAVNSRGKDYHTGRVSVEGKKLYTVPCQPCSFKTYYSA